eukprot:m.242594 g.242594  ORF g.242594 m.242594 type:complete len:389 (+) comp35385_c0_seq1:209-1375(+)
MSRSSRASDGVECHSSENEKQKQQQIVYHHLQFHNNSTINCGISNRRAKEIQILPARLLPPPPPSIPPPSILPSQRKKMDQLLLVDGEERCDDDCDEVKRGENCADWLFSWNNIALSQPPSEMKHGRCVKDVDGKKEHIYERISKVIQSESEEDCDSSYGDVSDQEEHEYHYATNYEEIEHDPTLMRAVQEETSHGGDDEKGFNQKMRRNNFIHNDNTDILYSKLNKDRNNPSHNTMHTLPSLPPPLPERRYRHNENVIGNCTGIQSKKHVIDNGDDDNDSDGDDEMMLIEAMENCENRNKNRKVACNHTPWRGGVEENTTTSPAKKPIQRRRWGRLKRKKRKAAQKSEANKQLECAHVDLNNETGGIGGLSLADLNNVLVERAHPLE